MRHSFIALTLSTFACVSTFAAHAAGSDAASWTVLCASGAETSATELAVSRLRAETGETYQVTYGSLKSDSASTGPLIVLGTKADPGGSEYWADYRDHSSDAYLIKTISTTPTIVVASGATSRSLLYATYRLADLLKSTPNLLRLNKFYQPLMKKRYVSFGATTHGRREYRPELYWKTLNELPQFGYNGVVIYPGGGTPLGRHASPIVEADNGTLSVTLENTKAWKNWFRRIDAYGLDIMMTVPPVVPPGYDQKEIRTYYQGGREPEGYVAALQKHFRQYLQLLVETYPEVDMYMFNSTEGATFGNNQRFFGHPDLRRFSNENYLRNNDKVMSAYFEVLRDVFSKDGQKVSFWTHSFGLTSDGIRRMREILFRYPEVMILEDDFWNNNLWPFELPAMAYLPDDLRAKVSKTNPFALFQIATDGEYYGGGSLPNAFPDSHIRSANEALERKADMVIQRLDLHDRTPWGTAFGTMEIVPLAASMQLWEPAQTTQDIWHDWASTRFGAKAAPHVVEALQESKVILREGLSCNGLDLLCVGSEFAPRLWIRDGSELTRYSLFGKHGVPFVAKSEAGTISSEEYTAFQMKTHSISIEDFRARQKLAMDANTRGLAKIEAARPHLSPADYEMLRGIFNNGENVLKAIQLLGEAAYASNLVENNFDAVPDPKAMLANSLANLEKFLDRDPLNSHMTANVQEIIENYRELLP